MLGLKLLFIRKEGACRLSELAPDPSITLLIGSEGGCAAEEARAAERAGYRALRLGPRVLRTETVAVAALWALQRCGAMWDRRRTEPPAALSLSRPILEPNRPDSRYCQELWIGEAWSGGFLPIFWVCKALGLSTIDELNCSVHER